MGMEDRFWWLLVGMGIGFVLGYFASELRKISERVEQVDEHVTGKKRSQNEAGFMGNPFMRNFLILAALTILVYGVYLTNKNADDVKENADVTKRAILCNNEFLTAQSQFLRIYLEEPPATAPEQVAAVQAFVDLLDSYGARDPSSVLEGPFSNREALAQCIVENNTERLRQIERTESSTE